jgi:hypothetical protein
LRSIVFYSVKSRGVGSVSSGVSLVIEYAMIQKGFSSIVYIYIVRRSGSGSKSKVLEILSPLSRTKGLGLLRDLKSSSKD